MAIQNEDSPPPPQILLSNSSVIVTIAYFPIRNRNHYQSQGDIHMIVRVLVFGVDSYDLFNYLLDIGTAVTLTSPLIVNL